jgi:hypothetical protein
MASISVDVDIDDILWDMTSYEKQELVNELYEDGYVPKQVQAIADREDAISSAGPFDFDGQVQKLIGNSWRLSNNDVETILKITNKLV